MSAKKVSKKLGRGLDELLGEIEESYKNEFSSENGDFDLLPIDEIETNPYQPRKYFNEDAIAELAESIKEHGLLQPILVIEKADKYILIAGERRLRACRENGFEQVKSIILDYDVDYIRELSLIENIQREDLNMIEVAHSYKALIEDYEITHEALAQRLKKSRSNITNILRLLQLPQWIQEKIATKELSVGHTKVLIGLEELEQRKVVDNILSNSLSVRATEELIQDLKESDTPPTTKNKKSNISHLDPQKIQNLKNILRRKDIRVKSNQNKITMTFKTDDQIDQIIELLS